MTEKFEKLAEIKADFDFLIGRMKGEKHAEKRQEKMKEKEAALAASKAEFETRKKSSI